MMKHIYTVQLVDIEYKCPKCNKGFLKDTCIVDIENQTYKHECSNCKKEIFLKEKYPIRKENRELVYP